MADASSTSDGLWALCADATDLFADPPPPARARYELLGCAPDGPLRTALAALRAAGGHAPAPHPSPRARSRAAGTGHPPESGPADSRGPAGRDISRRRARERSDAAEQGNAAGAVTLHAPRSVPLGLIVLETLDRAGKRTSEWYLTDVRLMDERICARDLSLRDLTIEAAVQDDQPDYPHRPALSPGYRLLGTDHAPLGHCRDLATVGTPAATADHLEQPPIRLLGCSPRGALHAALAAGDEDLGHAKILRLDSRGRVVQYAAEGEIVAWIPSARGRGLVDLTLEPWSPQPPRAARDVWELWWQGRPEQANLWARCNPQGRRFWLGTALDNDSRDPRSLHDAPPGSTFHLDGRYILDEDGFYCALGEAVNGPGGYFGRDQDALIDCLSGGFGARPPFTLVWHDSHVARSCLGVTPLTSPSATFEELLALLGQCGVKTVVA